MRDQTAAAGDGDRKGEADARGQQQGRGVGDMLDQAIADVPTGVPAKRIDFAIQNDNGVVKPVSIVVPAELNYEEAHAIRDAVGTIVQQVVREAEQANKPHGLVIARGSLPRIVT